MDDAGQGQHRPRSAAKAELTQMCTSRKATTTMTDPLVTLRNPGPDGNNHREQERRPGIGAHPRGLPTAEASGI